MHVNNFVEIILGRLYNKAQISLLNEVKIKSEKINRGDVFIAKNKNEIENAINNGAYAIVSEKELEIIDFEIAWIVVEDLNLAISRFIKYSKIINNTLIYKCNPITYEILKNIIKDKNISVCNSLEEVLEGINARIIILDSMLKLDGAIMLESKNNQIFKAMQKSIFNLNLEYENNIYEIIFPYEFIEFLNEAIYFCKLQRINFVIQNQYLELMPIFINYDGNAIKNGRSIRFVYASKDNYLISQYAKIIKNARWGKSLFLAKRDLEFQENAMRYNSLRDIQQILKSRKYHFFLIEGIEKDELLNAINLENKESRLF